MQNLHKRTQQLINNKGPRSRFPQKNHQETPSNSQISRQKGPFKAEPAQAGRNETNKILTMFSYRFESGLQHGDAGSADAGLLNVLSCTQEPSQLWGFYISFTLTKHSSSAGSIACKKGPVRINAALFL
jgi:hypothetical protein